MTGSRPLPAGGVASGLATTSGTRSTSEAAIPRAFSLTGVLTGSSRSPAGETVSRSEETAKSIGASCPPRSRCNRRVMTNGDLALRLAGAGFVAAADEAAELLEAAAGDASRLEELVGRRLNGEPLEWITGWVDFCGLRIRVARGVYVPRWHSEALAERAARCLPAAG